MSYSHLLSQPFFGFFCSCCLVSFSLTSRRCVLNAGNNCTGTEAIKWEWLLKWDYLTIKHENLYFRSCRLWHSYNISSDLSPALNGKSASSAKQNNGENGMVLQARNRMFESAELTEFEGAGQMISDVMNGNAHTDT